MILFPIFMILFLKFVNYIQMDELEEDGSLEDKIEEEALPSARAPHLRGQKKTLT